MSAVRFVFFPHLLRGVLHLLASLLLPPLLLPLEEKTRTRRLCDGTDVDTRMDAATQADVRSGEWNKHREWVRGCDGDRRRVFYYYYYYYWKWQMVHNRSFIFKIKCALRFILKLSRFLPMPHRDIWFAGMLHVLSILSCFVLGPKD